MSDVFSNQRFISVGGFVHLELESDFGLWRYKICESWKGHNFHVSLVDRIHPIWLASLIDDIHMVSVDCNNIYLEMTGDKCVKLPIQKHRQIHICNDSYNKKQKLIKEESLCV